MIQLLRMSKGRWLRQGLWCVLFGVLTAFANAWTCTWLFSSQSQPLMGFTVTRDEMNWHAKFSENLFAGSRTVGWLGPFEAGDESRATRANPIAPIYHSHWFGTAPPTRSEIESVVNLRFGEGAAIDAWNLYRPDGHCASIFTTGWPVPLLYCATDYRSDGSVIIGDVYRGVPGYWFDSLNRPFFREYGFPYGLLPGFWLWVMMSGVSLFIGIDILRYVRLRRRRLRGACLNCGYSQIGVSGPCPECGERSGS